MIAEALKYTEMFHADTNRLKIIAPIYPEVYEEIQKSIHGDEYVVTSMVEFVYGGVKFKRHHVERIIFNANTRKEWCKERLDMNAKLCIKYAIPIPQDDIVGVENPPTNQ